MTLAYLFFGLLISRLDCSHENCCPGSIDYKREAHHELNTISHRTSPILFLTYYKHHMAYALKSVLTQQKHMKKDSKHVTVCWICGANIHHSLVNMFLMYTRGDVSAFECEIWPHTLERTSGCHWLSSSLCELAVLRRTLEGGWSCLSITSHKHISSDPENTARCWTECSEQCERMLVI